MQWLEQTIDNINNLTKTCCKNYKTILWDITTYMCQGVSTKQGPETPSRKR